MESETELDREREETVIHETESERELEGERDEAVTHEMDSGNGFSNCGMCLFTSEEFIGT